MRLDPDEILTLKALAAIGIVLLLLAICIGR